MDADANLTFAFEGVPSGALDALLRAITDVGGSPTVTALGVPGPGVTYRVGVLLPGLLSELPARIKKIRSATPLPID